MIVMRAYHAFRWSFAVFCELGFYNVSCTALPCVLFMILGLSGFARIKKRHEATADS